MESQLVENERDIVAKKNGTKKCVWIFERKKFFIHNSLRFVNEIYDGIVSCIDCSVAFLWV